ncbi:BLUF domain-containing protein [Brevundimonas lenta]|uniref:BLUF domain-containing protein n=1 Tax=Brevundimonas lenta TaxID=424796 RepID=A0A7W6J9X6_9CAUL|nr:BLUF domain-containing protein [Brevundimonas lenta]MBB4081250.1 hypothetical protein [Brevundimonas lenta]
MLHRVIYASEAVGATGVSTLSIAQILGASEVNNRRDEITGCVMFHRGHILQALEGGRADLDRLMRRLLVDPRHSGLRILCDMPIPARVLTEPMSLCADPAAMLGSVGLPCISSVTANDAEAMLDFRKAA